MEDHIQEIKCALAPAAIGPYSQAICAGGLVFVSGQIPVVPGTGDLLSGDIRRQTALVIENTGNILKECGLGLQDVVRSDIFLADMSDFSEMNAVYAEKFTREPRPARCVIQAAGLPKGAGIELSCIAFRKKRTE